MHTRNFNLDLFAFVFNSCSKDVGCYCLFDLKQSVFLLNLSAFFFILFHFFSFLFFFQ